MDDVDIQVPGAQDVRQVLRRDPLYRLLGARLTSPWVLGAIVGLVIVLMILFGPSSDSRFIYTDF